MSSLRKIDLMHHYFGKAGGTHTCKECSNLVKGRYHSRILTKCKVYGLTHSAASDWTQRNEACGMFNKEWNGRSIIELVKCRANRIDEDFPIDGQLSMESEVTNER